MFEKNNETVKIISLEQFNEVNSDKLVEWNQGGGYLKTLSDLNSILEGERLNRKDLRLGFIELAKQNPEREEKVRLKKDRATRKRLPKRQPMTSKIYQLLIQAAAGPSYSSVRLRIAFCVLIVTGIQINELLTLKVNQLQALINYSWIEIDRSKHAITNYKVFLTKEGEKVVEEREKDFQILFLMKDSNSYVFTSYSNHYNMLSRETLTREVNKIMRYVSNSLPNKPNITSYSFRVGYISKLCRNAKDSEIVQ